MSGVFTKAHGKPRCVSLRSAMRSRPGASSETYGAQDQLFQWTRRRSECVFNDEHRGQTRFKSELPVGAARGLAEDRTFGRGRPAAGCKVVEVEWITV
jgi:hypothetical protein